MRRRPLRDWVAYLIEVVQASAQNASRDNVPMMAAALSFYLLVAIVPLVAVAVAVIRAAGQTLATQPGALSLVAETTSTVGPVAKAIEGGTWWGIAITLVIVLYGASSVFSQFVLAITRIWREPAKRGPVYVFARRHLIGFLLLGVLAAGMMASTLVGSFFAGLIAQAETLAHEIGLYVPPLDWLVLVRAGIDFAASFLLFTVSFSLVPARKLRARQVAPGAAVTAFGYTLGQFGLSFYLSTTSRVDAPGLIGAVVALLIWVYYSALIALYGAEFTRETVVRAESSDHAG